jgi:hypothetical protein
MIHKESLEKFSYVVIQKQVVAPLLKDLTSVKIDLWASDNTSSAADLEPTPSPLKVLNRLIDGDKSKAGVKKLIDKLIDEVDWDNYTPRLERAEWGRVLRSPLKRKGHVSIDICAPTGDMVRSTLSKGPVSHIPSLFTAIKRTTWGGLHPMLPGEALKSPLSQKPNAVIKQVYSLRFFIVGIIYNSCFIPGLSPSRTSQRVFG